METAPYMSRQESFNSGNQGENRSLLQNTNSRLGLGHKHNFYVEEYDSENPSCDFQHVASESIPANKPAEESTSPPSRGREKENQRKTLGIQRYCEEMRNSDTSSSLLLPNDARGGTDRQSSQKKNLCGFGRGDRLEMLKSLSCSKKPGGLISNTPNSVDISNDDPLPMIKDMSLNETKNVGQTTLCKGFESENSICKERKINANTSNCLRDYSVDSLYNEQTVQDGSLPESNPSIFCKQFKPLFLPAGSEMSMLVPIKNKRKYKKCENFQLVE